MGLTEYLLGSKKLFIRAYLLAQWKLVALRWCLSPQHPGAPQRRSLLSSEEITNLGASRIDPPSVPVPRHRNEPISWHFEVHSGVLGTGPQMKLLLEVVIDHQKTWAVFQIRREHWNYVVTYFVQAEHTENKYDVLRMDDTSKKSNQHCGICFWLKHTWDR